MLSLIIISFLTLSSTLITPAFAAESTPSADIKAKLEELKKAIASKAAKLKQEVSHQLKDKAYIGQVKTKSPSSLTLTTRIGPKTVSINQDTVFDSKVKSKKLSSKTIAEEDYLATLGDVDETGVLTARKIILFPTPNQQPKTFLWGQIIAISDKLVTLKDRQFKNVAVTLPNPGTVKVSDFVILTGNFGKNDIFKAEFVYVIPQSGIIRPKKIATPSAQISTKSAQPKR